MTSDKRIGCLALVIVFGAVLALVSIFGSPLESSPDEVRQMREALSHMTLHQNWESITVSQKDRYAVTLNYKNTPLLGEPEIDTKLVARAVITELLKEGKRPARDFIMFFVYAQRPVVGETGENMVEVYGSTRYDPNTDQLIYEPWKR